MQYQLLAIKEHDYLLPPPPLPSTENFVLRESVCFGELASECPPEISFIETELEYVVVTSDCTSPEPETMCHCVG